MWVQWLLGDMLQLCPPKKEDKNCRLRILDTWFERSKLGTLEKTGTKPFFNGKHSQSLRRRFIPVLGNIMQEFPIIFTATTMPTVNICQKSLPRSALCSIIHNSQEGIRPFAYQLTPIDRVRRINSLLTITLFSIRWTERKRKTPPRTHRVFENKQHNRA